MNQDIQNKMIAASKAFSNGKINWKAEPKIMTPQELAHVIEDTYMAVMQFVLFSPELLKEAMVDMLDWIISTKEIYFHVYGKDREKKAFAGNTYLTCEDVANLYLEHLKQK